MSEGREIVPNYDNIRDAARGKMARRLKERKEQGSGTPPSPETAPAPAAAQDLRPRLRPRRAETPPPAAAVAPEVAAAVSAPAETPPATNEILDMEGLPDHIRDSIRTKGYVAYQRPEAIDQFADQHPNWTRTQVDDEARFSPPRREDPEPAAPAAPEAPVTPEPGPATPEPEPAPVVPPAETGRDVLPPAPTLETPPVDTPPAVPAGEGRSPEALNRAREVYIKAQRRLNDANGMRGRLIGFMSKVSREAVEREFESAKAEYYRARTEFVERDTIRHLQELKDIAAARIQELYANKSGNAFERTINKIGNGLVEGYKFLGEKNLLSFYKGQNKLVKGLARAASLRTVVMVGLGAGIGAGAIASGLGLGTAAIMRRSLTASGSAVGFYGTMMALRERNVRTKLENNVSGMNLDQVAEAMAQMEAMIGPDTGDRDKLLNDKEYQKLTERLGELLTPEANLEELARASEEKLQSAAKSETKARRWRKAIAVVGGATIGPLMGRMVKGAVMGAAHELAASPEGQWISGHWSGSGSHVDHAPGGDVNLPNEHHTATVESDIRGHNKDFGAESAGTESAGVDMDVTKRGIEGTLLDLKTQNAELYGKMIAKLHEQDPNFKGDDGGLVHRFALRYAQEHGLNIDQGGGKDLSRIFSAKIHFDADGTPHLGNEHLMPEASVSKGPVDLAHEEASANTDEVQSENTGIEESGSDTTETNIQSDLDKLQAQLTERMKLSDEQWLKEYDAQKQILEARIANGDPGAQKMLDLLEANRVRIDAHSIDDSAIPHKDYKLTSYNADFSDSDSSDDITQKPRMTFDSTKQGLIDANRVHEARFHNALIQEKTTAGLRLVLDKDYNSFLSKTIGLSESKLNGIKDMSYALFLEKMDNPDFAKTYGKLGQALVKYVPEGVLKTNDPLLSMHKVTLEIARNFEIKK